MKGLIMLVVWCDLHERYEPIEWLGDTLDNYQMCCKTITYPCVVDHTLISQETT